MMGACRKWDWHSILQLEVAVLNGLDKLHMCLNRDLEANVGGGRGAA